MERKDKDMRESGQKVYLKNRNSRKRKGTYLPQNSRIIQENVPKLIDKSIQVERIPRVPSTIDELRVTSSYIYFRTLGTSFPREGTGYAERIRNMNVFEVLCSNIEF